MEEAGLNDELFRSTADSFAKKSEELINKGSQLSFFKKTKELVSSSNNTNQPSKVTQLREKAAEKLNSLGNSIGGKLWGVSLFIITIL